MKYNLIATECYQWDRVIEDTLTIRYMEEDLFQEKFVEIFSKPENFDKVIVINKDIPSLPQNAPRYKFAPDEFCRVYTNVDVLKDKEDVLFNASFYGMFAVLYITKPGVTIFEDCIKTGLFAPVMVYDFENEETVNRFGTLIPHVMKSLELAGVQKDQRIYTLTHDWWEFYEFQFKDSGQPLPTVGKIDYNQYSQYWQKWIRTEAEMEGNRLEDYRLRHIRDLFVAGIRDRFEDRCKKYVIVEHNHPIVEGGEPVLHYHAEWGKKLLDKKHTLLGEFRLPMEFDKFWETVQETYTKEGYTGFQNWDTYK
jgi:hypothetical protein